MKFRWLHTRNAHFSLWRSPGVLPGAITVWPGNNAWIIICTLQTGIWKCNSTSSIPIQPIALKKTSEGVNVKVVDYNERVTGGLDPYRRIAKFASCSGGAHGN